MENSSWKKIEFTENYRYLNTIMILVSRMTERKGERNCKKGLNINWGGGLKFKTDFKEIGIDLINWIKSNSGISYWRTFENVAFELKEKSYGDSRIYVCS